MQNPYKPGGPLLPPSSKKPATAATPSKKGASLHNKTHKKNRRDKKNASPRNNSFNKEPTPENKHEITEALQEEIDQLLALADELSVEANLLRKKAAKKQEILKNLINKISALNANFGENK